MEFQKQNTELQCSALGWHDKVLAAGAAGGLCEERPGLPWRTQPVPAGSSGPAAGQGCVQQPPWCHLCDNVFRGQNATWQCKWGKAVWETATLQAESSEKKEGGGRASAGEAEVAPQPTKTMVEQMPTLQPVEVDLEVAISWRHDSPWRDHTVAGFSWQELWPVGDPHLIRFILKDFQPGKVQQGRSPLLEQFLKDRSSCWNRRSVWGGWNSKELSWTHHNPHSPSPTLLVAEEIEESGMEESGMKEWSWAWGRRGLGKMF